MRHTKNFVILFLVFILFIWASIFSRCFDDDDDEASSDVPDPGHKVTYTADSVSFIMIYVPGGKTFPTGVDDNGDIHGDGDQDVISPAIVANAYWIAETEVTYELWSAVYTWATGNGYTFANPGRQGGDFNTGPVGTNKHPVTTINWRDIMVWCNAATEWYNANNSTGYTLVYYTDSGYTIPHRDSTDGAYGSSLNPNDGDFDKPYIKAATNSNLDMANCIATGFRLLTVNEWELAARWRNDATNTVADYSDPYFTKGNSASGAYTYNNDVADVNPANGIVDGKDANDIVAVYGRYWDGDSLEYTGVSSTAEVKSKGINSANAFGLYDMSGNVFELCFDWHPDYPDSSRIARGGHWAGVTYALQVGEAPPFGFDSYHEDQCIGFRLARSE